MIKGPEVIQASRGIEIRHKQDIDLIINLFVDNPEESIILSEIVGCGVPYNWSLYDPFPTSSLQFKFDLPPNTFIDNDYAPQYIAKIRESSVESIRSARRVRESEGGVIKFHLIGNSVLNEIRLAPVLKSVLQSAEGIEIAQKYGFQKIVNVEPLVGVVDRGSGRKTVFYRFVDGVNAFESEWPDMVLGEESSGLAAELGELLDREGLEVGDPGNHQFLLSMSSSPDGNILYLVDTEHIWKK